LSKASKVELISYGPRSPSSPNYKKGSLSKHFRKKLKNFEVYYLPLKFSEVQPKLPKNENEMLINKRFFKRKQKKNNNLNNFEVM
jgi:hypothetical protein